MLNSLPRQQRTQQHLKQTSNVTGTLYPSAFEENRKLAIVNGCDIIAVTHDQLGGGQKAELFMGCWEGNSSNHENKDGWEMFKFYEGIATLC